MYKARDMRLDHTVAIKVLRPDVATDADRLRRFEQEARAAPATLDQKIKMALAYLALAGALAWAMGETHKEWTPERKSQYFRQLERGSQRHGHSSVSTFRRARWTIRSGDFVHRLSGLFGDLGASQHANGDAGGCEIGEGHWASARRRGAGGASRRPVRRGDNDRHWSETRRTSHFDDQARTADQRASTGADEIAP